MNNTNNLNNLSEKELINRLVEVLHCGIQGEFCLLQFSKRKIFTISIGSPPVERSYTHVLIIRCTNLNYIVDFVDLEHSFAYSYYASPIFLKTLYDGCFFNEEDYFSFAAVENNKEVMFIGNITF